jgi:hypothetical protein
MSDLLPLNGWHRTWVMVRSTAVAVAIGAVLLFGLAVLEKLT